MAVKQRVPPSDSNYATKYYRKLFWTKTERQTKKKGGSILKTNFHPATNQLIRNDNPR